MEIFGTDNHKIIRSDALKALETQVLDNSVDLIFADPPYNIGKNFNGHIEKWTTEEDYLKWCYEWWFQCSIATLLSNISLKWKLFFCFKK